MGSRFFRTAQRACGEPGVNAIDRVRTIADSILYEGYLLYPYTRDSVKNQYRWQFGVLMPPGYADASEPTSFEAHLLGEAFGADASVDVFARFLQAVESETTQHEIALRAPLREGHNSVPFTIQPLRGTLSLDVVQEGRYLHLTVRLENETPFDSFDTRAGTADRNAALQKALISAQALLCAQSGGFVSLIDPPDEAAQAAAKCKNRRIFPVLVGERASDSRRGSMMLASPIILYDFPAVAPESSGHTFDATEIDELLLLSVASLTDEERRRAGAGDPRARAIVERAEAMDAASLRRLHGRIVAGQRVRVHPKRRADAFDLFAAGRTARVLRVQEDVEGRNYVAVVFEGDPAGELHEWYGRSFFYDPDELETLEQA